jgi:hypothetical protein
MTADNWRDLAGSLTARQRQRLICMEMESSLPPETLRELLLEVAAHWSARHSR